ncbi:Cyclopropane-fatty-acyl-phospholipid synthase [metagenome]|uniref:Cyclopropane-fatty-acyl-phospholipid synthase n=1 Tax=metagenome TaxID=256318 RepID=A0A2P2CKI0_9ZZZZ
MSLGSGPNRAAPARMSIGDAMDRLVRGGLPVRFTAYDGSSAGPLDAPFGLDLRTERGLAYLMTAPGDLGMARAYVSGDLDFAGVHPGDPYDAMVLLKDHTKFRVPTPSEAVHIARSLGLQRLRPPAPPPQEHLPRWRRAVEGLRHSMSRDADVISHHYDVSNRFYELVLGPSMAYTCALYETPDATLEEAQAAKFDLVCRKLALQPGQRLLDVGCGWGTMVRHAAREYGVKALGVTLSLEQAQWAKEAIDREGLGDLAEVRHLDYRDVVENGFDAVSSIGLTEHIGVRNYTSYFAQLRDRLKPGGRVLNHCITRPHNRRQETGAFIDRYVFPDGELIGSGTIITAAQDAGLEVQHSENIRMHYASTLRDWNRNLVDNWDECVAEVGEGTARVWGLYIAGSRIGFERDEIELHHVLATRNHADGHSDFPMRPDW